MMQLIITALKAEAMPIIDYYKLEKGMTKFYPYFRGEDLEVICCGVGGKNLKKIIADYFKNGNNNVNQIINIGIAGCSIKSHNVGESFLVNKVFDETSNYIYDINPPSDLLIPLQQITTVRKVKDDGGIVIKGLVDMEAHLICSVFEQFILSNRLFIYKIISDHMDLKVNKLSFRNVYDLINLNILKIDRMLDLIKN
tara:strand:+ start:758 stop:1348 length:591 start_codon:yes stop_codon:yes gene_type:complete